MIARPSLSRLEPNLTQTNPPTSPDRAGNPMLKPEPQGALVGVCFGENTVMRRIEGKQLEYDLTPVGGLALVGHYLKVMAPQWAQLGATLPVRSG